MNLFYFTVASSLLSASVFGGGVPVSRLAKKDPDLLNDSLESLNLEPLSFTPPATPPAAFTPPDSSKVPYDPSVMDDLVAFTRRIKSTTKERSRNDFFLASNAAIWSKLIPAARDNVAKPAISEKFINWDVLRGQLDFAISVALSNSSRETIEKRLRGIEADWRSFTAKREELLKKKPGMFSRKVVYTPTELSILQSFYDSYKINHAFVKRIIGDVATYTDLLVKYQYIKPWLDRD